MRMNHFPYPSPSLTFLLLHAYTSVCHNIDIDTMQHPIYNQRMNFGSDMSCVALKFNFQGGMSLLSHHYHI